MLLSINICIHKVLYSTSTDVDSCILSKVQPRSDIISALKSRKKGSIAFRSTFGRRCIEGLAELWIRPSDKGLAKLLLSGLSVSDSPVLSDGCCRHRSMHHTLVKAPLLHSPPFRWKSTPWSRHTYTYVLTGTLTRLAHTQTQTHTYTDTFPLWWQILPELAPICESWRGVLYESNSPVICLSQMGVQGPCLVPMIAGQFWFKPPTPNPQIEKCVWNVFLKLWVVRGEGSPARGVRLIIMARLGLIH